MLELSVMSKKRTEKSATTPDFIHFARAVFPALELTPFHETYYRVLEAFARGVVRRLIVTVPPQHGKSLGACELLPAYLLGIDPDRRITIASYAASLAMRFNRRVQRLLLSPAYEEFFPQTLIKGSPGLSSQESTGFIRTGERMEVVGREGELFAVGREGALTGNRVDTFILDDLYRDAMEADSPLIRENCWEWYTSVVKTRQHNASSELLVFTRWHEEDLIGRIGLREPVERLVRWDQLEEHHEGWLALHFEALKEGEPTEVDPRLPGEALWPARHSARLLQEKSRLDPWRFEALYQGHPCSREGLLYGENFVTYDRLPADDELVRRANYTDTADMGDDFLCSVCYVMDRAGWIYVTDVVYSRERMEVTERLVADMLEREETRHAWIESNNGGRGFARSVARLVTLARIEWFSQQANKEARILSNSSTVLRQIRMPVDWKNRWPLFARHLTTYRRNFKANRWHDAPDVLTGIVERETVLPHRGRLHAVGFLR